jgi:hypothetical protein
VPRQPSPIASVPARLGDWLDRYYLLAMAPVGLLVLGLNYHGLGMQGVVPNYEDFKRIILAGFDPAAGIHGVPTFPMWGYGWLLLLTEHKLALLLLQHALALAAAGIFLGSAERGGWLDRSALRLVKGLLIVSLPWYAFHSLRWPYSIAISLFLVSCALLADVLAGRRGSLPRLLFSALCFGGVLNFRSEYIYLPLLLLLAAAAVRGWGAVWGPALLWLAVAYLLLVPWALYAKRATGHYLLTSTNGGHVLFTGLGNLPDNKWGITPSDGDPVMRRLVEARFGRYYPSLRYDSDRLLTREFLRRVREDPGEYLRKVVHVLPEMLLGGVYHGEFFERPACQPGCVVRPLRLRQRLLTEPLAVLAGLRQEDARTLLLYASGMLGRLVVLGSFLWLPAGLALAWRQRNGLLLLTGAGILYQAAVGLLAHYLPTYTANMYFFHLVNLCGGLAWLYERLPWRADVPAGSRP